MKFVLIKKNGCVLRVILNRPEKRNAFHPELINELTHIFSSTSLDKNLRLIHISGAGSDFCAGADLQWMSSCSNLSELENYDDADQLFSMYQSMQDCYIPIVSQVHGHVFGGGIGLCAASDIVIANKNSIFSLSEPRRGLIPAVMMPFIIEALGKSRVRELLITGREFSSDEAMNFGLVHFTTEEQSELALTKNIIKNILATAPEAIKECRFLINHSAQLSRQNFVEFLAKKRISDEAKEGLASFFEKRQPAWEKETQFLSED